MALSAVEVSGHRRLYRPEPIVLIEPPNFHYPPRVIPWKPRYRYVDNSSAGDW